MITDPELDIRHGTRIGRFVVVGELGKGGMGVVYAAHDPELDRKVALKVLRAAAATEEERLRMLREGQAMARITHPNVITVYEVGVEGTLVFLAQELLDGGTLGEWLEKRERAHPEILQKFLAAGRGLAAAHAAGLVHRDFKPDNVLLGKDGRVRVSDFGLARSLDPGDADLPAATRANMVRAQLELAQHPMSPLTRTGAVMGTPMFMAPEQHNGELADERCDQFAFSVALYQALYGAWPFAGKTAVALADAVIEGRIEKPPAGNKVPARLRAILVRGLSPRPDDRYPSMNAMLADIARPPSRRGRTIAIAAIACVAIAGAVVGGYTLATRGEPDEAKPVAPSLDPGTLTAGRGLDWLSTAVEKGQLVDASEKYEMAGALELEHNQRAQAAIAWAASSLVFVLRGDLEHARARTRDVDANKGKDAIAMACADLAAAAIASASGDLPAAIARSERCAGELTDKVPLLGAMCLELEGEAAAAKNDLALARQVWGQARELAKKLGNEPLALALELALAELDLDAGKQDDVAARAQAIQTAAADSGAVSVEARAWILLARAHVAQAETQKALDDLGHVKPATLEWFDLRLQHQLALGAAQGLLGDPDEAYRQLDAARSEAEKHGYPGLVLAGRLARVMVEVQTGAPDAAAKQKALAKDARDHGYLRIARLVETIADR